MVKLGINRLHNTGISDKITTCSLELFVASSCHGYFSFIIGDSAL